MEHNHPINEINARAAAIGYPLRELCEAAGVNPSTYWRWQRPDANPRLRDMQDALTGLEAALKARELLVLERLTRQYPDAASQYLENREAAE